MSQPSKHVDWCLKKAGKEREECLKSGKRVKHRGLLKIEPNLDKAKKHIAKAEHNFNAITKFREIGFSDWSITAGFYSIYHCFLAIACKFGFESGNQECTISLMKYLKEEGKININNEYIDILKHEEIEKINEYSVIDLREDYTYGVEVSVKDQSKINDLIKNSREIIDIIKGIVFES